MRQASYGSVPARARGMQVVGRHRRERMAGAAGWALAAGFVKVYETELTRPKQRNAASGLEASLGNGGRSTHVECGNLQAHRSSYPISSSSPFFKRVHPLDLLLGQAKLRRGYQAGSARWPQPPLASTSAACCATLHRTAPRVSRKNFKMRQGTTRLNGVLADI